MDFPELNTRTLTVNGVELSVVDEGEGGIPLMLVHGFTGTKEDFADEVHDLVAAGFHVVAPDQRGHGASGHAGADGYSFAQFASDLFAVADQLAWRSFHLLGHSMGGMIAQVMALDQPARIHSLVLMDTHHGTLSNLDQDIIQMGADLARAEGLEVIQQILKMGEDPLDNPAYQRLRRERPGYAEWSDSKMLRCDPHMYAEMLLEIAQQSDRLAALTELASPTLVLVGEVDEPFVAPSERMAEAIASARLVVIPEAGHSPQFENRQAWRQAVHDFLSEQIDRSAPPERREP